MMPIKKPIILFVSNSASAQGGAELCLFRLAEKLAEKGYRVAVALPENKGIALQYHKRNIPVYCCPMPRARCSFNPLFWLKYGVVFIRSIFALAGVIKRNKIDIVHMNEYLEYSGLIAACITGRKAVVHVRVILQRPALLVAIISRIVAKLSSKVICVSQAVKAEMFDKYGIRSGRIGVIYDAGPDDEYFIPDEKMLQYSADVRRELDIQPGTIIIGMIAKLVRVKGHKLLIEIAERLLQKGYSGFKIVLAGGKVKGHEDYYEELVAAVERSAAKKNIILLGYRPDVLKLTSSFDVILHLATYQDPFPGTVLEAMSLKKPVIAFAAGGLYEQLDHGNAGILIRNGDAKAAADKLLELIEDPDRRKNVGMYGYEHLIGNFNWGRHLKEIEDVHASIAG